MNEQPSDFGGLSFSRVVIVGANGAGKTWMARRMAASLGVPVIAKDALALTTRWRQRPRDEVQIAICEAIAAGDWVLEGGPSVLTSEVLARASLVVWLDIRASVRFWRILRRSLWYFGRTRPEHPAGNRDWPGLRQTCFAWQALVQAEQFAKVINRTLQTDTGKVLRLSTTTEVGHLLQQLQYSRAKT